MPQWQRRNRQRASAKTAERSNNAHQWAAKHAHARRVREAIDAPMLLAMTEPLLPAYEDGLRTLAAIDIRAIST